MGTVKNVLKETLAGYTGKALAGQTYMTISPDEQLFTVIGLGEIDGTRFATTGLVVRLVGEAIVIERDQNDKPLVDALIRAGIPLERIILAYAGERGTEVA